MTKFFIIFLAIAFGLMAFASVQEELPEELAFLKSEGGSSVRPATGPGAYSVYSGIIDGWSVVTQGPSVEVSRRFKGELVTASGRYDVPTLAILCHAGRVDLRIDTRHPTQGKNTTSVAFGLEAQPQEWQKGFDYNIFPPDPSSTVLALLRAGTQEVPASLHFTELGQQTTKIEVSRLGAVLAQFPKACPALSTL